MKTYAPLDTAGVAISSLCIVHCLLLPVIGTSLPLLGTWSEVEWIHKVLVILALPIGLGLILFPIQKPVRIMAALGLILLLAAAFFAPLHDYETPITVIGALLLGTAHIFRLTLTNQSH